MTNYTKGNKSSVTKGKEQGHVWTFCKARSARIQSDIAPSFQQIAPKKTVQSLWIQGTEEKLQKQSKVWSFFVVFVWVCFKCSQSSQKMQHLQGLTRGVFLFPIVALLKNKGPTLMHSLVPTSCWFLLKDILWCAISQFYSFFHLGKVHFTKDAIKPCPRAPCLCLQLRGQKIFHKINIDNHSQAFVCRRRQRLKIKRHCENTNTFEWYEDLWGRTASVKGPSALRKKI